MATIIILSDIHGNLPALEALWADASARPIDELYCLGDVALFGPWPEEAVQFLREKVRPDRMIRGNTDRYLIESDEARRKANRDPAVQDAIDWTRDKLSPDSLKWLESLPSEEEFEVGGAHVRLVHGGPGDDELGVGPSVEPVELERLFGDAGAGYTFCGHTHVPFRTRVRDHVIINTGSVGMPFDGDQRGSYLRGRMTDGMLRAYEVRRVAYPVGRTLQALVDLSVPLRERTSHRLRFAET